MGFIRDLEDLHSDDPYVVGKAARELGRLGDPAHVPALVAAYDEGGFLAFQRRPQENPARGSFGGYRDKVQGLAKALWMIGDASGLDAARRMLSEVITDGQVILSIPPEAMTSESRLLTFISQGTLYFDEWRESEGPIDFLEAYRTERPASWHPDPLRRHEMRYWDGHQWTPHVFNAGIQSTDDAGLVVQQSFERLPIGAGGGGDFCTFVIDVSNVVRWRFGQGNSTRLRDYHLVTTAIEQRWPGSYVRAIADASLRHRIRESEPQSLNEYEALLQRGEIVQAPAGTSADRFIIQEADAFGGYMVTNDLYNKEGEKELAPETVVPERFVRFHFADDTVFLDTKGEIRPMSVRF